METHIVSVQYTGKVCFWFQKAITGISGSPSKGQLTEIDILIFFLSAIEREGDG